MTLSTKRYIVSASMFAIQIRLIADRDVTTRMFSNWAMRRADDNADCIEKAAFLVGYARRECSKMAREILEIISTS